MNALLLNFVKAPIALGIAVGTFWLFGLVLMLIYTMAGHSLY